MITQDTATKIWSCHREIAAGEKLLADLAEVKERTDDKLAQRLQDCFGRRRDFELGVPSGETGHRIFQVAPDLAESIIRAHIANKQAELVKVNEQARIELGAAEVKPIDMIIFCPKCHLQHIDAPEEATCENCGHRESAHNYPMKHCAMNNCFCREWRPVKGWDNPPHKSHKCHGCGIIFRFADVPTNGVAKIKTVGELDTKDLGINPNE